MIEKNIFQLKKLGEIAKINYGYTEKSSFNNIGPKFLRITDIQDNDVTWEKVPFCKIHTDDLPKYLLKDGDIVFARTGATTGKSFLIKSPPSAVFASYLIRLQILDSSKLVPEFLFLFFQTKDYWDHIKIGISGSAQGGFNATKLAEIQIPIPSIEEQHLILSKSNEFILAINKLNKIYKNELTLLEELKKSLLQRAFHEIPNNAHIKTNQQVQA